MRYIDDCKEYTEYYENQRNLLDALPSEASVAATTFYTTYLSQRNEIYDIRYGSDAHIFNCDSHPSDSTCVLHFLMVGKNNVDCNPAIPVCKNTPVP